MSIEAPMTTILQEAAAGRATIVPWTVEQYHRAIETGFLPEDTSVELLDGFIVHKDRARAGGDPMTIGDRHRTAVLRLAQLAPAFERLGCFLQTQQPISLPPISEPEPDAAVIRGGIDDYLDHPPSAGDVFSVIEIADSSLSIDVGPKLAAYAGAGIRQYIVADLVNNRVLVHEQPAGHSYLSIATFERGGTVQISAGTAPVPMAADRLLP
jgi:Uma2 family endonuclease